MSERDERMAEAHEEMWAWATGRKSHLNELMRVEGDPENRQQTLVAVAQADAAEVQKWAAVLGGDLTLMERVEALVRELESYNPSHGSYLQAARKLRAALAGEVTP